MPAWPTSSRAACTSRRRAPLRWRCTSRSACIGIVRGDDAPLLGLVSLLAPALAMGNCVVAVPSQQYPLLATDLYQVIEYSDVPAGAINIVTGKTRRACRRAGQARRCRRAVARRRCRDLQRRPRRNRSATSSACGPATAAAIDWFSPDAAGECLPAPRGRGEECLGALRRLTAATACTAPVARRRAGRCNPTAGTSDTCARTPDNCRWPGPRLGTLHPR